MNMTQLSFTLCEGKHNGLGDAFSRLPRMENVSGGKSTGFGIGIGCCVAPSCNWILYCWGRPH
jgi:hypothetical protein